MSISFRFIRSYGLAVCAALVLHGMLFIGIEAGLLAFAVEDRRFIAEPKPLRAQLIRLNIERPAPPSPVAAPTMPEKSKPAEQVEPVESKEDQLARLERERAERLAQIQANAFQEILTDEVSQETESAIQDLAQVYIENIYLDLVANWSRPPSARNNMSTIILVELFPNGELNSAGVVESSGNEAFDRSALNAVKRAAPFTVPQDLALFEERFRSFTLNFRPEDLLR